MKNFLSLVVFNIVGLRGRYLGLLVAVALCSAVSIAGVVVANGSTTIYSKQLDSSNASRTIVTERSSAHPRLAPKELAEIGTGATSATGNVFLSGEVVTETRASTDVLSIYNIRLEAMPPVVGGKIPDDLRGGIVLPASLRGKDMRSTLGKKIEVLTNRSIGPGKTVSVAHEVTVVALYDPAWQIDSTNAGYVDHETAISWLREVAQEGTPDGLPDGYSSITTVYASGGDAELALTRIQQSGYRANILIAMSAEVPESLQNFVALARLFQWVAIVLGGLLLAVFVNMMVRARRSEFGILFAVGRSKVRVAATLGSEFAIVSLIGWIVGLILSIGISYLQVRSFTAGTFIDSVSLILPTPLVAIVGGAAVSIVCGTLSGLIAMAVRESDAISILLSPKE